MSHPRELLRRMRARSQQEIPVAQIAASLPVAEEVSPGIVPERTVVPNPIRENTVYRQLMQKHDRMHTRHLKG